MELIIHGTTWALHHSCYMITASKSQKSKRVTLELKLLYRKSWCFKYVFIGELVGSNTSRVSSRSRGLTVLLCYIECRIHEMQTIVTDVHGVCLSVRLPVTRLISASLCKNGWTDQDAVWGEHSSGSMENCIRHGSWFPHREWEGGHFYILGPPSYLWIGWN